MMQFESIKSPTDLENYPLGTVLGGSLETYVRTQLFGFLPVGMMTGSRRVAVYYKP